MISFYPWPDLTGTVTANQGGAWDIGTVGTITNPVAVTDGGGSITVDGTVGVSGTVTVAGTVAVSGTVPVSQSGDWTVTIGAITGVMNCIGPQYADDPADGYRPLLIGGRASDTPPTVDANGDACWAWFDLDCRLAVWDGDTSLSVDDGGGSITVDGTVGVSGTVTVDGTVGVSGTVTVGTHAVTQSGAWNVGTVTALTGITNPVAVTDGGGSITVDAPVGAPVFVRLSDGSAAISTLPVSLASVPTHAVTQSGAWNVGTVTTVTTVATLTGITNVVHVDDNGGSLTVDGSVSITGTASVSGTVTANQGGTWSVTADTELPAAAALADGAANPTAPLVGACVQHWNGAAWDRETGNLEGTALASATRAATTSSAVLLNRNCRGVMIFLDITAAGTGSLSIRLRGIDPVTSSPWLLMADAATITTSKSVQYGPGATGALPASMAARVEGLLTRQWQITIVHSDASNWTYSVGYALCR